MIAANAYTGAAPVIRAGLRVDVDTLRGAGSGVPNLIALLSGRRIRASFFFAVGPDNMGRHLRRLLRPAFLIKMLRTGAPRLYGWDILLRGTLRPGPVIGKRCREQIRKAAAAGHEIGLHAWDHHLWQTQLERLDRTAIAAQIKSGCDLLTEILGHAPDCFAAPAWQVTPEALQVLEHFPFRYQSDCRGRSIFRPVLCGLPLGRIQVPTTLPTFDELIGRRCSLDNYNDQLLEMIRPGRLNVLTIHAEVEGIRCLALFGNFLEKALRRGIVFQPLGEILARTETMEESGLLKSTAAGREGWLACQDGGTRNNGSME